ncbi:MAG: trypsin-like peptidase domain-containing protein [Verrucomicrobia bacterium]|nr:trypsin-like peptidase domain-containing protein [Verrucomicrobiota bacterium]
MNFRRVLASPAATAILTALTAFAILAPGEFGFGQNTNPKQAPGVADLVARVAPSVVSITVTKRSSEIKTDPFGRRENPDQSEIVGGSQGSGVILSSDGYIITNNHVVDGASGIIVTREDVHKDYHATLIGTDPDTDLALIKISESNLPALHFAEAGSYRVGDAVLAIGNAFGLGQSVSMGIVSAIDRPLSPGEFEDYIQTDAAINHGNSGGALVNLNGDLIGINTRFYADPNLGNKKQEPTPSGVNFAIAAPLADSVMQGLKKGGKIRRAYLGAELQTLTPGLAAMFSIPENVKGVIIVGLVPDSPAGKAGLQPKDVITALDGNPVKSSVELERSIIFLPPGKTVEMDIYREGQKVSEKVALGERPLPED